MKDRFTRESLRMLAVELGYRLLEGPIAGVVPVRERFSWSSDPIPERVGELESKINALLEHFNLCVVHEPAKSAPLRVKKRDRRP